MKYIVTGGAGFIGSHLVETLSRKHEIVVIDDLSTGREHNLAGFRDSIRFARGNITSLALLKEICGGADGIFHEAAIASVPRSVENPLETNDVNITGTLNTLIAARECGVKKVVFASSAAVYGENPVLPKHEGMIPEVLSPYAVAKLTGEHYCSVFSQLYGVETVSLRYFNVFGPRQDPNSPYSGVISKFITNILNKKRIVMYGDGKQTRDFVFVKDVVQANTNAMGSNARGVFNVACQKSINLLELAETIMEITGNSVPVTFEAPRAGDIRDSLADISRAKKDLGYAPQFSLREGIEETVEWFMAEG